MPGLVPGIHVFLLSIRLSSFNKAKTWMAGTSPAMDGKSTHSHQRV
jgi:hypothetical protein